MKRFLFPLTAAVKLFGTRCPSPRRLRRAFLQVESMEERLALSTSPLGLSGPDIALPEAVCGYKHRGRCPRSPYNLRGEMGTVMQINPDLLAAAGVFFGGTDGTTVGIAGDHLVVTPPLGPLPTE
jgi:hypothetical protein